MMPGPNSLEDAKAEMGVSSFLAEQARGPTNSVQYLMTSSRCFQDEEFTYFVNEYVRGGELFTHVSGRGGFPEAQAKTWARQIVEAVACLHANGVAHRDISLENTLLATHDNSVRIFDFGQAVSVWDAESAEETPAMYRGIAGKAYYRAPEMNAHQSYEARPVDAFAVGVLIFIMVTGVPPWGIAMRTDQIFRFIQGQEEKGGNGLQTLLTHWGMQARVSPVLVDLLRGLLKQNPQERMTIEDARNHAWFTGGGGGGGGDGGGDGGGGEM